MPSCVFNNILASVVLFLYFLQFPVFALSGTASLFLSCARAGDGLRHFVRTSTIIVGYHRPIDLSSENCGKERGPGRCERIAPRAPAGTTLAVAYRASTLASLKRDGDDPKIRTSSSKWKCGLIGERVIPLPRKQGPGNSDSSAGRTMSRNQDALSSVQALCTSL